VTTGWCLAHVRGDRGDTSWYCPACDYHVSSEGDIPKECKFLEAQKIAAEIVAELELKTRRS
jgi:hypothetical protein